jgi:hypothetical protein
MSRHTSPQRREDELRFPIRVKVRVPPGGLGNLVTDADRWLRANLEPGAWAHWPVEAMRGAATAYHFRRLEDAARFFAAFPGLEVADDVGAKDGRA